MANHHPSDELLMLFSAGQLPNALGVILACHLQTCPECRAKSATYDQLGGDLLQENGTFGSAPITKPQAKTSTAMLDNLLARLDEPAIDPVQEPSFIHSLESPIPKPLHRFTPEHWEDIPWRGISKYVQQHVLPLSDSTYVAKFLKIGAGKQLPQHTHRGNEYTLIMDGSFSDSYGDYFPGDFVLANTEVEHQPQVHFEKPCICLAVMDAPIKMTGIFTRLMNPFFR